MEACLQRIISEKNLQCSSFYELITGLASPGSKSSKLREVPTTPTKVDCPPVVCDADETCRRMNRDLCPDSRLRALREGDNLLWGFCDEELYEMESSSGEYCLANEVLYDPRDALEQWHGLISNEWGYDESSPLARETLRDSTSRSLRDDLIMSSPTCLDISSTKASDHTVMTSALSLQRNKFWENKRPTKLARPGQARDWLCEPGSDRCPSASRKESPRIQIPKVPPFVPRELSLTKKPDGSVFYPPHREPYYNPWSGWLKRKSPWRVRVVHSHE